MKQTAVEWLIEQRNIIDYALLWGHIDNEKYHEKYLLLIKQAKQMEIEQSKAIALQNEQESKAIPELSDGEIEIEAELRFPNTTTISFDIKQVWIDGAKWYRKQLKQRQ